MKIGNFTAHGPRTAEVDAGKDAAALAPQPIPLQLLIMGTPKNPFPDGIERCKFSICQVGM
jgi:hypothetical protein